MGKGATKESHVRGSYIFGLFFNCPGLRTRTHAHEDARTRARAYCLGLTLLSDQYYKQPMETTTFMAYIYTLSKALSDKRLTRQLALRRYGKPLILGRSPLEHNDRP